jgi:hypothetical protein
MSNPDNNPNEAYTVIPMPAELCGNWTGWCTVTRNGAMQ